MTKTTEQKTIYMKNYMAKLSPEKLTEYRKRYYQKNRTSLLLKTKLYKANKRQSDIQFKLKENLRSRLFNAYRNNSKRGSAINDLGCSIEELKIHLESKFQEGMTWENWNMTGWHVDHIIPLVSFDLTDREQFLKACHYSNLQPLWAADNFKKNRKKQ